MKKFLHFVLTPIIAVLLIILKIPDTEQVINKGYKNESVEHSQVKPHQSPEKTTKKLSPFKGKIVQTDTTHIVIIVLLIVFTIYNYLITVISPYNDRQKDLKRRWGILDEEANELKTAFEDTYGVDLSFSIMRPRKRFLRKDDNGKRKFKQEVFKVVWTCGTHRVNSRLEFKIEQGVSGQAYRDEDCFGYDFEALRADSVDLNKLLKLNAEQIRLTNKVSVVASCPIFLITDDPDMRKVKVIGVLNVECRMEGSGELLIGDTEVREELYENMAKLANFYTRIS